MTKCKQHSENEHLSFDSMSRIYEWTFKKVNVNSSAETVKILFSIQISMP
jgi:hypothetical protein